MSTPFSQHSRAFRTVGIWTCSLVLLASPLAAGETETPALRMQPWQAVVLGVVEGLTEYLPVSSTGHLILTERALGLGDSEETKRAADGYTIVIQMGAILAVAGIYHEYLKQMLLGLLGRSRQGLRLLQNLLLAFLPAGVVGLTLVDQIKAHLFGLWPVTLAWGIGGVALMIWGDKSKDGPGEPGQTLAELRPGQALIIGLMQTIAVWPGTSRSLVTILGGRLVGLRLRDAVIFSFLLGMLTLSASTGHDLLKEGAGMVKWFGVSNILIGILAAALSAWVAVKGMVGYLKQHGLKIFGGYRIAMAMLTATLIWTGVLMP
jgi:undecaprenyl-diphosphatase